MITLDDNIKNNLANINTELNKKVEELTMQAKLQSLIEQIVDMLKGSVNKNKIGVDYNKSGDGKIFFWLEIEDENAAGYEKVKTIISEANERYKPIEVSCVIVEKCLNLDVPSDYKIQPVSKRVRSVSSNRHRDSLSFLIDTKEKGLEFMKQLNLTMKDNGVYKFVGYIKSGSDCGFLIPIYKSGDMLFYHSLSEDSKSIIGFTPYGLHEKHVEGAKCFRGVESNLYSEINGEPIFVFKYYNETRFGTSGSLKPFLEKISTPDKLRNRNLEKEIEKIIA